MTNVWKIKLVAVGDGGVGKTTLIHKYIEGKFEKNYMPTMGFDITATDLNLDGKSDNIAKILIFDTGGQEYLAPLRGAYYKGAHGVFLVVDVTDPISFQNIERWLNELQPHISSIPIILIGNKVDLNERRKISTEELLAKGDELKFPVIETSAFSGKNVSDMFVKLTHLALKDELRKDTFR